MKEKQIDAGQLSEAKKCDLAYQDQRASNSRSLNAIRCLHRGPRYGRYWVKKVCFSVTFHASCGQRVVD
jgi:hypothetical protein